MDPFTYLFPMNADHHEVSAAFDRFRRDAFRALDLEGHPLCDAMWKHADPGAMILPSLVAGGEGTTEEHWHEAFTESWSTLQFFAELAGVPPTPIDPTGPRVGDWILTASGRQVWPLDVRPGDLHFGDMVHALHNCCRFTGHTLRFYSVGEHSVRVAKLLWALHPELPTWARAGLSLLGYLHDGSEAWLIDLPAPLKWNKTLAWGYLVAEARMQAQVEAEFLPAGLLARLSAECPDLDVRSAVHHADMVMLATERRDLMHAEGPAWTKLLEPQASRIEAWFEEEDHGPAEFIRTYEVMESWVTYRPTEEDLE